MEDWTPPELMADLDATERVMTWLYDQARHRAETEPEWTFTQGNIAQAIAEWRCFRTFLSLGTDRSDRADAYAVRCQNWLSAAADDIRERRHGDVALAETTDQLHRDTDALRSRVMDHTSPPAPATPS